MVRLLPVFVLLVLALLPVAQAQTPADPLVGVSVMPGTAGTIPLGGSATIKIDVQLNTNYIFCQTPGTLTVKLELKDKDAALAGITSTLPATIDVPIKANVQPPQASTTSSGNATALLMVTIAKTTAADHAHTFTVTATTPTALPSGCNSLNPSTPPKAATESKDITIQTGPAPLNSTAGGASGSNTSQTKKSFFVPLQLEIAVLLAVGLLRRRA